MKAVGIPSMPLLCYVIGRVFLESLAALMTMTFSNKCCLNVINLNQCNRENLAVKYNNIDYIDILGHKCSISEPERMKFVYLVCRRGITLFCLLLYCLLGPYSGFKVTTLSF